MSTKIRLFLSLAKLLLCSLLHSTVNAQELNSKCKQLVDSFIEYRDSLSANDGGDHNVVYLDYAGFEERAEASLKDESFLDFMISKNDIALRVSEDISRFESVMRSITVVESYKGICKGSDGDLFLRLRRLDGGFDIVSFVYKKVDGRWLLSYINLFNYSSILKKNGSQIKEFTDLSIKFDSVDGA